MTAIFSSPKPLAWRAAFLGAAVVFSLGACSSPSSVYPTTLPAQVAAFLAVEGTSVILTDKTIGDHIVSHYSGKNCSSVRLEQGRTYCVEDEANPVADVYCYRTLGNVTCYKNPDPSQDPSARVRSED
ncbi:hypothetical protein [Varunaivibrio sulfuroxidans]|uniref:Lipoprotein n=1 Tax=Varunaivibrio sulfuroxidans TaxID=1773489 RepID=A0A4R3J4H4_9PROT|nr:hypothetical protein [Varunaivibrio sulfuroxidans]TCS60145.1 hypothetical protein EDD55_11237 [Varunaivibrio sulfuroxidans]WES30883.1 hypothetical protein P3M64_00470 [Varunaivibrio sulfuroxidans]